MSTFARIPLSRGPRGGGTIHPLSARTLLAVVTAAALAVAGFVGISRTLEATSPGPLGIYAGYASAGAIQQLGSTIGVQPAYAMDFLDGSSWQTIVASSAQLPSKWPGYRMIWGVDMLPNSGASMASEAGGAYDQYFVQVAQNLVAGGQGNSVIRLGWEFNGDWFPWGTNAGSAADFVGAFQHVVTAMRSVPGQQFRFEWNPTRGGNIDLASYYPGDAYVDWVGLDVYDTEWANYPGAQAEFDNMVSQQYGLNWLAQFAAQHGKAIALPEWGLGWGPSNNGGAITAANQQVSGGDDPTFIRDMAQWVATHNVAEANFWDYGTSTVGGGQNPNTLAALASSFGPAGVASGAAVVTPAPAPPTTTPPPPSTTPAPTTSPPTTSAPTTGPSTTGPPATTPTGTSSTTPHVAVVMMENRAQSEILGNSQAPYLNSLAQNNGLAANSFAQSHPSLENYLAQWYGITGVADDSNPPAHEQSGPSIGDAVSAAGDTWRAYAENYQGFTDSSLYQVHHLPQLYSTADQAGVVSYSQLAGDLAAGKAPNLLYIVPNMCNDTHDCAVATGDAWLAAQIPELMASSWYADDPNASIIITWDESQGSDTSGFGDANGGRIFTAVISRKAHAVETTPVDQVGVARSVLECFGLSTAIGEAADGSHGDLLPLMSCPSVQTPKSLVTTTTIQTSAPPPPTTTPTTASSPSPKVVSGAAAVTTTGAAGLSPSDSSSSPAKGTASGRKDTKGGHRAWRATWFGVDFGLGVATTGGEGSRLAEHLRVHWAQNIAATAKALGELEGWAGSSRK